MKDIAEKLPCMVLEGGGVKCAYQYGVLLGLSLHGRRLKIGGVSGTSFGALNAALYISGGVERLAGFWERLSPTMIFHEPRLEEIADRIYAGEKVFDLPTVLFVISQWRNTSKKRREISDQFREIVMDNVDEAAIRASHMDFGLVTVEIPGFEDVLDMTTRDLIGNYIRSKNVPGAFGINLKELLIEDIDFGMLPMFVAASANYAAFNPFKIGDSYFIDGGVYDNIPVSMMERAGYNRFICIRTNSDEPKKRWSDDADVTFITPSEDLGSCAMFSRENIKRLISLGRSDAEEQLSNLLPFSEEF